MVQYLYKHAMNLAYIQRRIFNAEDKNKVFNFVLFEHLSRFSFNI